MQGSRENILRNSDCFYPTEYLLSRIKGRRMSLITDWDPLVYSPSPDDYLTSARYHDVRSDASPENIWIHLLKEFRWVYRQMNSGLREIFQIFFLYTELRTLFFCLRFKAAHGQLKIAGMLTLSLLSKKCKEALLSADEMSETIAKIEEYFLSLAERFRGITARFIKEGLPGFERHLTEQYLEYAVNVSSHPVLRDFFMRIIDSRNLISLAKQTTWNIRTVPHLVNGGTIAVAHLRKALKREVGWSISSVIRRLTKQDIQETDLTGIENLLYKDMSRHIKKQEREPDGIGLILDYLWRCSVEARNLSIILYGKELDRGAVMSELVP